MTSESQFDGESIIEAFNQTLAECSLGKSSAEMVIKNADEALPSSIHQADSEQVTGGSSAGFGGGTIASDGIGLPVFDPIEPQTLEEAGLQEADIEALTLKFLNAYGNNLGRQIAKQIKLPFGIVQGVLNSLKNQMLVSYKSLAVANDYEYELTEIGYEKASRLTDLCSYCGAAPVGFKQYVESVKKQSLRRLKISPKEVKRAFSDLLLPQEIVAQIGQAVNSGRCIFLYGESGNGKTSIATRCIESYDSGIWIPRTLTIGGEIIRFYDPTIHEALPTKRVDSILKKSVVDDRWIRIKRPKIVVGGELTFAQLEITQNRLTGVLEAPLHMKSNNGCLVVDDFGRQRLTIKELLNRWIIPLENGMDYLRLPNGRAVPSPFDQLLVFSTNLEPDQLGDDAFFRRIPYKVELTGPTESQFVSLLSIEARNAGFVESPGCAEYLVSTLKQNKRSLKYCYVSDIIKQCCEFCEYHDQEKILTKSIIDLAVHNYFVGL